MRLLNLYSLPFKEFYGEYGRPPYAILSHRWTKDEASHRDFVQGCDHRGSGKITDFCTFARGRLTRVWNKQRHLYEDEVVLQWGWVDTICIDKTSSQEVSESINSMFAWYEEAAVCYVFLRDVPPSAPGNPTVLKAFANSEWFERGWTLQEMLASRNVIFCNQAWQVIGHKCTHGAGFRPCACAMKYNQHVYGPALNAEISRRTNINPRYLRLEDSIFKASIACRLSWAARRDTTRIEDMAYCLLGILEVNMPLLYGEGGRAWERLQEEIIKRSSDQSIFAWARSHDSSDGFGCALANEPVYFAEASNIVTTSKSPDAPYALTNIGLGVRARTRKIWDSEVQREVFVIWLNCGHYTREDGKGAFVPSVMTIARVGSPSSNSTYKRVWCSPQVLAAKGEEVPERLFYVRAWPSTGAATLER
ncbi:hypothetical protein LTR17_025232 [Elasticomyces elasticus]|nr:hypothetical protein LTR17_025232 [Elasticomyces elasticus]